MSPQFIASELGAPTELKVVPPTNQLLGATAGPTDGNVRAIVTIMGVGGLIVLFSLMICAETWAHATFLDSIVHDYSTGFLVLVTGFGAFYFGKRSGGG